jgi:hypothetical protein
MMPSEWISVEDSLPSCECLKKYCVLVEKGSIKKSVCEEVILGKTYPTGFRFLVGDWKRVTHWKEYNEE